ncbi:hypothetical protein B484DRAFT_402527 [Ochromonadaceae sp. CCMP2298]|nr:hypothetical protein B484DRAFT_402527 [Ochromonadaceae sp. CCMP2298]
MSLPGGFGNTKEATPEEQSILEGVKAEIEEKLGAALTVLELISFQTQVVAGINYIMKAKCNDGIVHIKVCKPLPHTGKPPFVMAVEANKDLESPIEHITED